MQEWHLGWERVSCLEFRSVLIERERGFTVVERPTLSNEVCISSSPVKVPSFFGDVMLAQNSATMSGST